MGSSIITDDSIDTWLDHRLCQVAVKLRSEILCRFGFESNVGIVAPNDALVRAGGVVAHHVVGTGD